MILSNSDEDIAGMLTCTLKGDVKPAKDGTIKKDDFTPIFDLTDTMSEKWAEYVDPTMTELFTYIDCCLDSIDGLDMGCFGFGHITVAQ